MPRFFKQMERYFITGIGTDVGKTIASAIVVEALQADYWKPIQAGDLSYSDTHKVKELVSNAKSSFYDNTYALNTPMSPHAAAAIDGLKIEVNQIKEPNVEGPLVIEGAGGLLVPINNMQTVADLIKMNYKVILVSQHYLGSINHTLLSINELKNRGLQIAGLIFNGIETPTTEEIIEKQGAVNIIGRIEHEERVDKEMIRKYAQRFKQDLIDL